MKTQQKILVVDDDLVVGKSFERVLRSKGYAVINCQSGEEALERMKNDEFDAVFTDLNMPGMNGMEVAAKVKESQPWMPVVIVTGFGTDSLKNQATLLGVSEFIQKPLSPEMIEKSAERAMREKEAIAEAFVVGIAAADVIKQPHVEETRWKDVALFMAAPFIGLVYAISLPFVGLSMLAYHGFKAAMK